MPRFGLTARLGLIAALLAAEILVMSYLVQQTPSDLVSGPAAAVRQVQHWLFRFMIAYAVCLAMLAYLRGAAPVAPASGPVRMRWAIAHAVLLVPFGFLSLHLYETASRLEFAALAVAWHACAIAASIALFAAMAPIRVWLDALRPTAGLALFALLLAAAAVAVIQGSQSLWVPSAELTFRIVKVLLHPLYPDLQADLSTMTISTDRFAVAIAEVCSGLEGIGLMLAFCCGWLWLFRREFYFPQALLVVPVGLVLVFLLNALRIAALVIIGDAGYERIATVGFHSQAGWIGFNLAAFGVAILARHSPWISRIGGHRGASTATAAYLMPLLAILAAGMLSHALSAGFEVLYPLRFAAALAALWIYRRGYAGIDWRVSWRAPLVGAAVFAVWAGFAHFLASPAPAPGGLNELSAPLRAAWILCRLLAAVLTVPLAEELAYRGFLLRRLSAEHFETLPYSAVRWPALAVSSIAFGAMHGAMWIPGILAGAAFGALAMRTGRLGESIAAHAASNALLATYVLVFDQWQLW